MHANRDSYSPCVCVVRGRQRDMKRRISIILFLIYSVEIDFIVGVKFLERRGWWGGGVLGRGEAFFIN